jgi:hypothetical protein
MTLFPGAIWRPIPVSPSRPKRGKGRAVILHVAVSEGASLFPIFSTTGNDSHLYVRKDGSVEQYIDLELVAYASIAANANTISVETQGGVTNPDGEPWTAAQVATLARIARWAHDTEGVPLSLMPNSLPASKGIGHHRLGIDPWRVAGGEVWSSSRGKLCPGAAKIAQIPQIITAAIGPIPPTPPTPPALGAPDMRLARTPDGTIWLVTDEAVTATGDPDTYASLRKVWGDPVAVEQVDITRLNAACVAPGTLSGDLRGDLKNKGQQLNAIAAAVGKATPQVDPEAVKVAVQDWLTANVAALGEAVAAGLATRVGNG